MVCTVTLFFPYGYVAVAVGAISISLRSVSVSSRRFPTAGVCFSVLEGFFLRTTESHSAHERLNTPQEHPITHDWFKLEYKYYSLSLLTEWDNSVLQSASQSFPVWLSSLVFHCNSWFGNILFIGCLSLPVLHPDSPNVVPVLP